MKFKDIAEFALGHIEPDAQTLKMASLLLIDTLGVAAGAANMHGRRDRTKPCSPLYDINPETRQCPYAV